MQGIGRNPHRPRADGSGAGHITTREIWALTWPQALMMFFQFLVGLTDVTVAGLINADTQAALGIINQCQFFLMIVGIAVVNGGVAAMSQSYGAGLVRRAERYAGLLLKLTGALCLCVIALGALLHTQLFSALRVPAEILPLTKDLWLLTLIMLPGSFATVATSGIFRARKNVRVPLISGIVVCAVNTVGDLGFGLGLLGLPNLGAEGLILASILSVTAGALVNLYVLIKTGPPARDCFAPYRWERLALPYILKVALPGGATQILWQLGYLVVFLIAGTLPEDRVASVAGMTAGMRIEAVLFLPAFAFSMTGSILVGRCLGAGDKAEAKRVGLRVAGAGALCMSLVGLCLLPWTEEITALIAPDPIVQTVAQSYLIFNIFAVPFTVTTMIMSGIFTGAGATMYTFIVFSVSVWLVRLPLAWLLGHHILRDASGIFAAMLLSQIVQSSACLFIFQRRDWYRFSSLAGRYKPTRRETMTKTH